MGIDEEYAMICKEMEKIELFHCAHKLLGN